MSILILEDDFETGDNYKRVLEGYNNYECILYDNVIDFDYFLYDNFVNQQFDYFIIDLSLDIPADISEEAFKKWANVRNIEFKSVVYNDIPIYGWDYFIQRIAKHEKTKDNLDKFIIISGFKEIISRTVPLEEFNKATHFLVKGKNNLSEIISIIER